MSIGKSNVHLNVQHVHGLHVHVYDIYMYASGLGSNTLVFVFNCI